MTHTDKGLLPCPFCGGEARMHGASYMTKKFPACTQCGAERGSAEDWNRRAPTTGPGRAPPGGWIPCGDEADKTDAAVLRLARLVEAEHKRHG